MIKVGRIDLSFVFLHVHVPSGRDEMVGHHYLVVLTQNHLRASSNRNGRKCEAHSLNGLPTRFESASQDTSLSSSPVLSTDAGR